MNRNICGFLIGLGAGVGVGILLAPKSGEKTRSLIRDKAADGAAYLRQRGTEIRDAATEAIEGHAREFTKRTDAVKSAVDAGKRAFSESMQS